MRLRRAEAGDANFVWKLYAETTKPLLEPKLKHGWKEEEEKRRFETWWDYNNTMIAMLDDKPIGWISFQEKIEHVDLEHVCIAPRLQSQGYGKQMLNQLLDSWRDKVKSIETSVLNESPYRKMFENLGFTEIRQEQITIRMRRTHS